MRPRWLAHDRRDLAVLAAALGHGGAAVALLALAARAGLAGQVAAAAGLALLMEWGSNTVSHIHLHAPLFRPTLANRAFSLYLSALLGVPQRVWTRYHLRHHELHDPAGPQLGPAGAIELALVAAVPALLAWLAPPLALVWAGGIAAGYGLCALQGHGEHATAAAGVDHRGRIHNTLWFNDGFHAAHHRVPSAHWTSLPGHGRADDARCPWPPALRLAVRAAARVRWVVPGTIDLLERLVLASPALQRFLLRTHERALRVLCARAGLAASAPLEVVVVGGGLFPRSGLLLGRILPAARLTLIDRDPGHLAAAARFLTASGRAAAPEPPRLVCATFDPAAPPACDVLVIPLAFRGDRRAIVARPPAPVVLLHDWWWRRGGDDSVCVSWLLLKRLVLLRAPGRPRAVGSAPAASNGGNVPCPPRSRPWPPPPQSPPCCPTPSSMVSAAATRPPS